MLPVFHLRGKKSTIYAENVGAGVDEGVHRANTGHQRHGDERRG